MTTGKFIPDSKIPHVEEIDMGNGIKQLIIKYMDENVIEAPKQLHIIPFMPRERIIDMKPTPKKRFPWHDFWVFVITLAPIMFTLIFADILMKYELLLIFGVLSVAWIMFVFLVNTKFRN